MVQTTFSLFEAIKQFAANIHEARLHVVGHIQIQYTEVQTSDFDINDHLVREVELILELRSKLVDGRLEAQGIPHGAFDPVRPSPEWWADAKINLLQNTAQAHGTTLAAVSVWRSATAVASVTEEVSGVTAHQQWMLDATKDGWVKKESLIDQCRARTSCTCRQAQAAYAALPADRKRKPGRPAKAG